MSRKTSFKELLNEMFSAGQPPHCTAFLFIVIGLLPIGFFFLVYLIPLPFLQLKSTIYEPTFLQILGLFLAGYLQYILYHIAWVSYSIKISVSILNYLNRDISDGFYLKAFSIEDYVDQETMMYINASRLASMRSDYPLGKIFVICPYKDNKVNRDFKVKVAGELKGFAAVYGVLKNGGLSNRIPPPLSLCFVSDEPKNLGNSGLFKIYHELGHITKYGWRVRIRTYNVVVNCLAIFIWVIFSSNNLGISLVYLVIFYFCQLYHFNKNRIKYSDEKGADYFAIRYFPRQQLEMLRKIIGKIFKNNQIRREYLNSYIEQRINNSLPWPNWEYFSINIQFYITSIISGFLLICAISTIKSISKDFLLGAYIISIFLTMVWMILSKFLEILSNNIGDTLTFMTSEAQYLVCQERIKGQSWSEIEGKLFQQNYRLPPGYGKRYSILHRLWQSLKYMVVEMISELRFHFAYLRGMHGFFCAVFLFVISIITNLIIQLIFVSIVTPFLSLFSALLWPICEKIR